MALYMGYHPHYPGTQHPPPVPPGFSVTVTAGSVEGPDRFTRLLLVTTHWGKQPELVVLAGLLTV